MKNAEYADRKTGLLRSLGDIDDEHILEAAPTGRNAKRSYRALIAAAAGLAAVIALIFLGSKLIKTPEAKQPVLPPIRMSERPGFCSFVMPYNTPREFVEGSDAIARVRIGDWLGDTGDMITTKFEAEVTELIKGELPKKITLLQEGGSDFTLRGNPLYTAGNELLLFLNKCQNFPGQRYTLPDDAYISSCSYIAVFDIVRLENGEEYALARHRLVKNLVPGRAFNVATGQNQRLRDEISAALKRSDPIWETTQREMGYIYSLDALIAGIKWLM